LPRSVKEGDRRAAGRKILERENIGKILSPENEGSNCPSGPLF